MVFLIPIAAIAAPLAIGLIVYSPFVGLVIFTFFLYIPPATLVSALSPLHITRVIAIFTFIIMLAKEKGKKMSVFKDSSQTKYLLLFMLIMLLSMTTSIWRSNTISAWMGFIKVFVGYFLVVNIVRSVKRLNILTTVMILAGLIVGASAISNQLSNEVIISGPARMRAHFAGQFADPNDLALMFIMLIPFAIQKLFTQNKIFTKTLSLSALGIFIYGLILTGSRGGLLGFLAILFLYFLRSRKKLLWATAGIVLFAVLWINAPQTYKERITGITSAVKEEEVSAMGRINAWEAGLDMMSHRLFGVGAGNFGEGFYHYRPADAVDPAGFRRAAHNAFIQVGGETGFPGLIIFSLMILSALKAFNRTKKQLLKDTELSASFKREMILATDASYIALVSFCVTAFFLSQGYNWILYYFIAFSVILERLIKAESS